MVFTKEDMKIFTYLFLLACPLMHIFMHGGHKGHNHSEGSKRES
ncbi:MAG: DUF2933 domain-containing protein [Bdellovibrionales bacterium]|nr:DUF2933 domain-containing protein [Bdellovibrionales bacterium]